MSGDVMDWAVAEAPFPNEQESGDRYLVQPTSSGILIAVVDGTGHGVEAAAAAKIATGVLQEFAGESLISLVLRCHEEVKGTRGAVMTLAFLSPRDHTMTWLSVGNIDTVLFQSGIAGRTALKRAVARAGVIGFSLPALRIDSVPVKAFDTLIMATDGIQPDFAEALSLDGRPQRIADNILSHHRKPNDDALVLVARYLGGDGL